MEFKINTYNEDYIIIDSSKIIYDLAILQIQGNINDNELTETLNQINISINNYKKRERTKGNLYKQINEVAIEKNSNIGKLIMNKANNPEYIYFSQLTHALQRSIDYEEWEYCDKLIQIIKTFKTKKCMKIDYQSFKLAVGDDLSNYIISSAYLYPSISRETVYLYKKGKISLIKLSEKSKVKIRIK